MVLTEGILFAVLAMLGWGTADFLAKKAVDKYGDFRTLFLMQIVGLVVSIVLVSLFSSFTLPSIHDLFIVTFFGIIFILGYLAFYKSMKKGLVSLASPIASSWSIIAVLLGVFLLGETLTWNQTIGLSSIIVGIILISINIQEITKLKLDQKVWGSIKFAFIAMITWGVGTPVLQIIVQNVGIFNSLVFIRIVSIPTLFLLLQPMKVKLRLPQKNLWGVIIALGVLDLLAFLAFNIGIEKGFVSIISPISSAFPLVTILLAYLFLKERLKPNQWLGVIAIVLGIVSLAII